MKFTWGIMGLGTIAKTFVHGLSCFENAEIVVGSRSLEKARAFAKECGAARYYGSYEELVSDEKINAIYVATPMSAHYENVRLCLLHGKNVLCEKTVTLNAAQWKELCALAKSRGLFLAEAMWTKHLPSFKKAKQWLAEGKIGKPLAVYADFSFRAGYNPEGRLFNKKLGGGALFDIGVYCLTFACEVFGYSPKEIISAVTLTPDGVDGSDAIILKYGDAFANLTASFERNSDSAATIIGENGTIFYKEWFFCTKSVELYSKDGELSESFSEEFLRNGYENEAREAMEQITAGETESKVNPQSETLAILQIMDEIRARHNIRYEGEPFEV